MRRSLLASFEGQKVELTTAVISRDPYWKRICADLLALIKHSSFAQGRICAPEATRKL